MYVDSVYAQTHIHIRIHTYINFILCVWIFLLVPLLSALTGPTARVFIQYNYTMYK